MYVRSSNYNVDIIKKIYNSNIDGIDVFYELIKDKNFIKKINIISRSLEHLILDFNNIDKIKKEKVIYTLCKYLLRMSSSGMGYSLIGYVSDENIKQEYTKIILSIDWLNSYCEKIFKNQDEDSKLKLFFNQYILEFDLYYLAFIYNKRDKKTYNVKIEKEKFLGKIVKIIKIKKKLMYRELFGLIKLNISNDQVIKDIINLLYDNNIIKSELNIENDKFKRMNLFEKYILEKNEVKKLKYNIIKLEKLNKINEIDEIKLKILKIESSFSNMIDNKIENIFVYENYNKLASKYNEPKIDLHNFEFFRNLNALNDDYIKINEFVNKLEMRYGKYFKKKLHDIIIENDFAYDLIIENKYNKLSDLIKEKYNNYFLKLIQKSIIKNEKIIKLDSKDIKNLNEILINSENMNKIKYKVAFDFKYQELNKLKLLTETSFFFPKGSFKSKYCDLDIIEDESSYIKNIKININAFPDVGINISKRKDVISFNSENIENIDFDNIYLGIDEDGIFLEDKKANKKIIPVIRSVIDLNYKSENQIARFLVEIGKYILTPPTNFKIDILEKIEYIPRIQLDNYILSKETWIFTTEINCNINEFIIELRKFFKKYKIYTNKICMYMPKYGREIPVYLFTELGNKILYDEYRKYFKIIFREYHFDKLKEEKVIEKIINLEYEGKEYKDNVSDEINELLEYKINDYDTFILLINNNNLFNIKKILCIIKEKLYYVNKNFFYIIYKDNNSLSIRLRVKKNNLYNINDVFNILIYLQENKLIKYFYIGSYYNELNRFGGQKQKKLINNFFENDSIEGIKFIQLEISKDEKKIILIEEILYMLKAFFIEWDIIESIMVYNVNKLIASKCIESYFNKNKILELFNKLDSVIIDNKYKELREISKNLDFNCSQNKKSYIILSYIHIYLNRRLYDKNEEKLILSDVLRIIIKRKYLIK